MRDEGRDLMLATYLLTDSNLWQLPHAKPSKADLPRVGGAPQRFMQPLGEFLNLPFWSRRRLTLSQGCSIFPARPKHFMGASKMNVWYMEPKPG
jgi:hypothetical protein